MDVSLTFHLSRVVVSERKAEAPSTPACTNSTEIQLSDEALIAQIVEGSKEALGVVFRRYSRIVRGIAYRVLRDASEADDLMQDIFLLIHRLCGNFDSSKGTARAWILQMTYCRALCRRRFLTTRHFYQQVELDKVTDELPDSNTRVERFEDTLDGTFGAGRAEEVFASLSENQQQTLRLYFVEGYTLEEIAEKLGQSKGNVKHHYFRGIERLRKALLGGRVEPEIAVS